MLLSRILQVDDVYILIIVVFVAKNNMLLEIVLHYLPLTHVLCIFTFTIFLLIKVMQWKTHHTSNRRLSRSVLCLFFFVFSHFIIVYFLSKSRICERK